MTKLTAYILFAISIAIEIAGGTMLKLSDGNTKIGWTIGCLICYVCCFLLFSHALPMLNLGIAYATWSGVGIIAMAVISALAFGQKIAPMGFLALALIVVGVVLLNTAGHPKV